MAIHKFVNTNDEKVEAAVIKYWAGEEDVFKGVKHILDVAGAAIEFLPKNKNLIQIIKGIFQ